MAARSADEGDVGFDPKRTLRPAGPSPSSPEHPPLVSGRVSVATNATAAPTETYQKNQLLRPMPLSHWMTSAAVPPNRATVRSTRTDAQAA